MCRIIPNIAPISPYKTTIISIASIFLHYPYIIPNLARNLHDVEDDGQSPKQHGPRPQVQPKTRQQCHNHL